MAETTLAVVGWVVSPVISLVIKKTSTYIENKLFKKAGIEGEMKKMKTTLTEILLFMGTIEKQKIKDQNHAELVRQIKDAVYDAEDIMDEFEYYLLKEKFEKQQKTLSAVASSSCRAIYQSVGGNQKFKKRVKEVSESLDRAKVSAKDLLSLMKVTLPQQVNVTSSENWHLTSPVISEEIVGRENECRLLIDLLLRQSEVSTLSPVISIVGQGGIGKTTLAQMVFNDPRVKDHFDKQIWLTVSDKFDMLSLTREMLKCVCENCPTVDTNQFGTLQTDLEKKLESKKILLMLDDVWYNKGDAEQHSYKSEWLKFLAPLKKAEPGSKIVLTTRDPRVERVLGTAGSSIPLDGLNEDDRWSLFVRCAFDGENQHKRQELEPIGKRIVNKLKGHSLAIRVVGTQLQGKSDVEEWNKTLNDNLLDNGDIMKILHRSYEHLPEHLKRCFAYCSLFPKDYHIKPDCLVHMWIAQGFVHSEDRNKLEDVGKSYFNALQTRSFFQVMKKNDKEYYVMHDLMSDLARHVSKGECYRMDNGDPMENLGPVRHLSLTPGKLGILKTLPGVDKLRTLIFLDDLPSSLFHNEDLMEVFIKFERLRVLDIGWDIESLQNIAECKYLRYLRFGNSHMPPDCFSKMHYLSALLIKNNKYRLFTVRDINHRIPFSLPRSIRELSSLVLIKTSKSFLLDVGGLAPNFQDVWRGGSACLHVKKVNGHGLDQLGQINNIKGFLCISNLENVMSKDEAIKAQLHKKQHVTELDLKWSDLCWEADRKYHEVLEALKPYCSIERLYIYGYQATNYPSWLQSNLLSRIESIKLCNCNGLEMLPALGQLPLLRKLWLESMIAVRRIGLEFYGKGTFPSLEEFVVNELWSLVEWFRPCDVELFPKLQTLRIMNCPNFTESNWDGFPALESLEIRSSDAMIMKAQINGYGCLLTIIMLDIINCTEIVTWDGCYELVSLKMLRIKNCRNLLSIPEMEYFYSLGYLSISDCPKLKSLAKKGLPVSLQLLCIDGTHLLEKQIRRKKGTEWDKVAAISGCVCFISEGKGMKLVKKTDRNIATKLCFNNGGPPSSMHNMKRTLTFNVEIRCTKCRTKVLKSAVSLKGIISVFLMDSDKLIVVGSVHPADVIICLGRKGIYADLVDTREHQPQRR